MTLVGIEEEVRSNRELTLALVEAHYRTLVPEVPVITYHAADSLTLRRHRKTCKGTKP